MNRLTSTVLRTKKTEEYTNPLSKQQNYTLWDKEIYPRIQGTIAYMYSRNWMIPIPFQFTNLHIMVRKKRHASCDSNTNNHLHAMCIVIPMGSKMEMGTWQRRKKKNFMQDHTCPIIEYQKYFWQYLLLKTLKDHSYGVSDSSSLGFDQDSLKVFLLLFSTWIYYEHVHLRLYSNGNSRDLLTEYSSRTQNLQLDQLGFHFSWLYHLNTRYRQL